jgi:hypothetical protein
MRVLTRRLLAIALGLSLLAEGLSLTGIALAKDDTALSRILFGFHWPGIGVAGLLVPELHEDDPNISNLELVIVWLVVGGVAWCEWFAVCLGGIVASRQLFSARA